MAETYKYFYIAELSEGKYYVGVTNNERFLPSDVFNAAGDDWVSRYLPCQRIIKIKEYENCYKFINKLLRQVKQEDIKVADVIGMKFTEELGDDWEDV